MQARNQPVVIQTGGGNTGLVVAGVAAAAAVGVGVYLYSKSKEKTAFTISKPVASPSLVSVGDSVKLSIPIMSSSSSDQDVVVVVSVWQAGFASLRGTLIEEKPINVKIPAGKAVTVSMNHVATEGGPTNNEIAMRIVGVGTFVGGTEVGNGRVDNDVFGVVVAGETIGFEFGAIGVDKTEVILNDYVNITAVVTSSCSRAQNVAIGIVVKQGGVLGQGEQVIGTPFKSAIFNILPGETKSVTYKYQAIGLVKRGRTVELSLYVGAILAPKTSPNNPYAVGDVFTVVSTPSGTDVLISDVQTRTSLNTTTAGVPEELYGKYAHFFVNIQNNSPFTLEAVTGKLVIADQTISFDMPVDMPAGFESTLPFHWQCSGTQELKSAVVKVYSKGVEVSNRDYGAVLFVIVPKILNLYVTNNGQVSIVDDLGNTLTPYDVNGEMGFKTDEIVVLKIPTDYQGKFDHFGGDTELGNWFSPTLMITMNRSRTITAYFSTVTPPPSTTTFSMGLYNPRPDTYYWRLEHFDANHKMDFYSEFARPDERVSAFNVSSLGNIGVTRADSSGVIFSTWYSPQIDIRDGEFFNFFDMTEQLSSAGI